MENRISKYLKYTPFSTQEVEGDGKRTKITKFIELTKNKIIFYKKNPSFLQMKINDSCITRSIVTGFGGGVIGFFFSLLTYNLKPNLTQNDAKYLINGPKISNLKNQFKEFYKYSRSNSINWAKFGFCFSFCECLIAKKRAKDDSLNTIYAACITGGLIGLKGGVKSSITSCATFAAFTALIEGLTFLNENRRNCSRCKV